MKVILLDRTLTNFEILFKTINLSFFIIDHDFCWNMLIKIATIIFCFNLDIYVWKQLNNMTNYWIFQSIPTQVSEYSIFCKFYSVYSTYLNPIILHLFIHRSIYFESFFLLKDLIIELVIYLQNTTFQNTFGLK